MSKWQKVRIGDVAIGIYDGPHATPPPCEIPGRYFLGIPQITPTGHIDLANPRYIAASDYSRWTKRVTPRHGDVVFSYEATLNLYAQIPEGMKCCLGRRMGLVRPDPKKLDYRFLYYYFFSPEWRSVVKSRTLTGATVDRLPIKTFPDFPITLPPLPTQKRIADILSAYDDLIENNRRRMEILEESARLIFKERFEDVWERGKLPRGWRTCCVPDCIEVEPEVANPHCDEIRYIPMAALSTSGMTIDVAKTEMRPKATSVRFTNGDVLLAGITPCLENGKTGFVNFLEENEVACGSTEFIVLRGRTVSPYFTYCLSRTERFRETAIKSMVGASGRQRVQPECFDTYEIALPTTTILREFDELVEPMFEQIGLLLKQNQDLAEARDMLLPKLMRGAEIG